MGQRATDSKFNPVTILLGVVSFLLTIISASVGYGLQQKDKHDDRMFSEMKQIKIELQYQSTNSQAHLLEFNNTKNLVQNIKKDIHLIEGTVGKLQEAQTRAIKKVDTLCKNMEFYEGWTKHKCE